MIGKCFRVIADDEETVTQWPQIKTGFEFQVLREYKDSYITGVSRLRCLKTDEIFDIHYPISDSLNDGESWFSCFFIPSDDIGVTLEEIGSMEIPPDPVTSTGKIRLDHFHGKEVNITTALSAFASQEGCDSEEYDLMMAAVNYIKWLETQLEFSDKPF